MLRSPTARWRWRPPCAAGRTPWPASSSTPARAASTPRARSAPRAPGSGPPVDGPARLGPGQRGHRVLALHPGVRAPLGHQAQHQGRGPLRGLGLHRVLQPPPKAFGAGHAQPGRLRAEHPGNRRRVTAAPQVRKVAAAPPLASSRPLKPTEPPLQPQGCSASRCARPMPRR